MKRLAALLTAIALIGAGCREQPDPSEIVTVTEVRPAPAPTPAPLSHIETEFFPGYLVWISTPAPQQDPALPLPTLDTTGS